MKRPEHLQSNRLIRFAVDCDKDLFLDLLAVVNLHGVKPDVGVAAQQVQPIKRYKKQAKTKASGKNHKPKRYLPSMMVRLASMPKDAALPPFTHKVHSMLRDEFGDRAFRKGIAKAALAKKLNGRSVTADITRLLDAGAMVGSP